MSKITVVEQTNNQAHFDYDYSKIFIGGNRYEQVIFTNLTGGALDYLSGTVVGRISASGKITNLKSGATDGSQFPVGVLATDITQLGAAADVTVNMCISGDVAQEKIILDGSDTLTTVISDKIIRDRIGSDTVGIILKEGTELTNFDNQ